MPSPAERSADQPDRPTPLAIISAFMAVVTGINLHAREFADATFTLALSAGPLLLYALFRFLERRDK